MEYPIASDKSFDVFQKRLRSGELASPQLNDQNRKRFGLAKQIVLDAYPADRPGAVDGWQGETVKYWPVNEG